MQWLRWYRGTHSDPKFGAIARKHGVHKTAVVAVWAGVLEFARGNGGSLEGMDQSDLAAALDLEDAQVQAIIVGFTDKGMIADSVVTKWGNRQFQSDNVTARVRKSRAKKRSEADDETLHTRSRNVDVTPPDTDTDTEDSEPIGSSAPSAPFDLKAQIFGPCLRWLAKQTGKPESKLRPMVGRWCSRYGDGGTLDGLVAAARASPVDPIAWIESILNGKAKPPGYGQRFSTADLAKLLMDDERASQGNGSDHGDPEPHHALPRPEPRRNGGTGTAVPERNYRGGGADAPDGG